MDWTASRGAWRTSSKCEASSCVEVLIWPGDVVLVRDGADKNGPVLRFSTAAWAVFVEGLRQTPA
ncbi:DUF397 domain-containing protein [Dactylosporangium sp. CS-047395]|uniref:DUF397 domain-containing protein n=1 Tax=Dactylosporangium sp. CS-047395 TaxID=3239936 RepID=UPI003D89C25F